MYSDNLLLNILFFLQTVQMINFILVFLLQVYRIYLLMLSLYKFSPVYHTL